MNRRDLIGLMMAAGMGHAGSAQAVSKETPGGGLLFRPQDFGAKLDGSTLDSPAINAAIERAHAQGGGLVYLSPGTYLCGTVVLRSNTTLFLEAGAVVLGSKDIKQYTPQPGPPANADANTRHVIFAKDVENVTICGLGVIDGQGPSFWVESGRQRPSPDEEWADVASLYLTPKPRVSPMLEFVNCRRLHISDVQLENASGWTMRLMSCADVVVDGLSIRNPIVGPNTDGIDISNSSDVRIANCSIATGDDAICLKSENPYGDTVPTMRNVTVTNCTLTTCCNGFKFGTRSEAGCENIVFSNSTIYNTADSELAARVISGICLEVVDGGWLENVLISGICMQRTRTPIFLRLGERTAPSARHSTFMRGVRISDIYATEAIQTSSINGLPDRPVEDIALANIHVGSVGPGKREWIQRKIPELPKAYPEARMFGRLPAHGLYVRHVEGIRMHGVSFSASPADERPAVVCDNVRSLDIASLIAPTQSNTSPMIELRHTKKAWVRDVQAPDGALSFLTVTGSDSTDILVTGCDLRGARQPAAFAENADSRSVTIANNILNKDKIRAE